MIGATFLATGLITAGIDFPRGHKRQVQSAADAEARLTAAAAKRDRRAAKHQRDAERARAGQRRV